jgi:hypothetical protein
MNNDNKDVLSENIEDLDISWIHEFEKEDNEFKKYYTEDLSFIKIHYIYINQNNDIEKIKEEKIILKESGLISKEELLSIIKHNSFSNQVKYSLLSILRFNISLEPIHLKTFLKNKNPSFGNQFLNSIRNIDSIKFDKSISMFHDINELIILFHVKINKNNDIKNIADSTRKLIKNIYIHSDSKRKTKRKELKEINL